MMNNVYKHTGLLLLCILVTSLLSGCLYPEERRVENQMPSAFYLEAAQKAVDQYRTDTGILPIVTKPLDTPIFEKYEVDFRALVPKYLPDIPANAFEKGGIYKYVIVDPETQPAVKLIHLGMVSKVADIQQAVLRYQQNKQKLPIDQDLGNGYYTIHFGLIGKKVMQVESLVGNHLLPLVMNKEGVVGIDYAADISTVLRSQPQLQVPANTDPRYTVVREIPFVLAKSFPYVMQAGEPQLMPH